MTDTDCRKCGAKMTEIPTIASGLRPIHRIPIRITGYACQYCGHWNDLKRRKNNRIGDGSDGEK